MEGGQKRRTNDEDVLSDDSNRRYHRIIIVVRIKITLVTTGHQDTLNDDYDTMPGGGGRDNKKRVQPDRRSLASTLPWFKSANLDGVQKTNLKQEPFHFQQVI